MNYCYILQCKDGTFYTGWTNDIEARFRAHCQGKGAKYTRGRRPLKLVLVEKYDTKELAMKREYEIKHLNRRQKIEIIKSWQLKNDGLIDSYNENNV